MARLGAHLRYFVRKKIAEDPAWQRPRVIFSGESAQLEGTESNVPALSMHCCLLSLATCLQQGCLLHSTQACACIQFQPTTCTLKHLAPVNLFSVSACSTLHL